MPDLCLSFLPVSSNTTLFIGPPALESAICAFALIPSVITPIPYAPPPNAIAVKTTRLIPRRRRARRPGPGCAVEEEEVNGCSCWDEAYEYALGSNAGFCFWKCSGSGRAVVCGGSLTCPEKTCSCLVTFGCDLLLRAGCADCASSLDEVVAEDAGLEMEDSGMPATVEFAIVG